MTYDEKNNTTPKRRRSTRAQAPENTESPKTKESDGSSASERLRSGVRNNSNGVDSNTEPTDKANSKDVKSSSEKEPSKDGAKANKKEDLKAKDNRDEKGSDRRSGKDRKKDDGKDKKDDKKGSDKANKEVNEKDQKSKKDKNKNTDNRENGSNDSGSNKAKKGSKKEDDDRDNGKNKDDGGIESEDKDGKPSSSSGKSLKDKAANATGVDYSDKSTKDQLEHQAADVVMDNTPYLSQFNTARKELKKHNKRKKDAGKDEGITDKAEEVVDDAVGKGIKGAKIGAGVGAGAAVGTGAMLGMAMMTFIGLAKGFLASIISKIAGFFGAIFNTVSSIVSSVLSIGTTMANALTAVATTVVVATLSVVGVGVGQELTKHDEGALGCIPPITSVSSASQEYIMEGEHSVIREENAKKLYSVYATLGSTKEKTAAVLGNFAHESGVDPTSIETVYDEPFQIGPRKQFAIENDYLIAIVDPAYSAQYPRIEHMGIGLAQWTNGRNRLLLEYAEERGSQWFEFDTQMMFMLEGDQDYRQQELIDFLLSDGSNVDEETRIFMHGWIGNTNNTLPVRQESAYGYLFILERADVDTDYAESILDGTNINRSSGNAAAGAYHQDDGCGNAIKTHYANLAVDGTGEVPADLPLVPWSRETLPDSLFEFAKDPSAAGLTWGNSNGWANGIYPGQCAALAHSYFMQLYPSWDKDGRSTSRARGDGGVVARNWALHYGQAITFSPSAGALFSDKSTSEYGHAGIVQHVFANGDILISEQNIRGVSGDNNGMQYSWSWRVIKKDNYEQKRYEFFRPMGEEARWGGTSL